MESLFFFHFLLHDFLARAIEPASARRHHRLRVVAPIIFPVHLRVRPPHGTVVIVILCPRMPHTRQCLARGSVEEIKKGARIFRIEMPEQPLAPIDLQRDLAVGQRNDLALGNLKRHAMSETRIAKIFTDKNLCETVKSVFAPH